MKKYIKFITRGFDIFRVEFWLLLGYCLFLVIPIFNIHDLPINYELFIILGFIELIFIFKVWNITERKKDEQANKKLYIERYIYKFAFIFCLIFITYSIVAFLLKGGISAIYNNWFKEASVELGLYKTQTAYYTYGSTTVFLEDLLLRIFRNWFLLLWGVVFLCRKTTAIALWSLYLLTNFVEYHGRFVLLSYIFIPLLCYILVNNKRVTLFRAVKYFIIIALFIFVMLPFLTKLREARVGENNSVSLKENYQEMLDNFSYPLMNATFLIKSSLFSDPSYYFKLLVTKPIPLLIWKGRPIYNFNYEVTQLLTGEKIGPSRPISVYTIFGEGWFFFRGGHGFLIILGLYVLMAKTIEKAIRRHKYIFSAYYIYFLINTAFYFYDNYIDYFGFIINLFIPFLLFNALWMLLRRAKRNKYS